MCKTTPFCAGQFVSSDMLFELLRRAPHLSSVLKPFQLLGRDKMSAPSFQTWCSGKIVRSLQALKHVECMLYPPQHIQSYHEDENFELCAPHAMTFFPCKACPITVFGESMCQGLTLKQPSKIGFESRMFIGKVLSAVTLHSGKGFIVAEVERNGMWDSYLCRTRAGESRIEVEVLWGFKGATFVDGIIDGLCAQLLAVTSVFSADLISSPHRPVCPCSSTRSRKEVIFNGGVRSMQSIRGSKSCPLLHCQFQQSKGVLRFPSTV